MKPPFEGRSFAPARKELIEQLGRDTVRALHARSLVHALSVVAGSFAAIGGCAWVLAQGPSASAPGVAWVLALLLQGFFLQHLGYLMHEFGVHRGLGRVDVSDAFGTLCGTPIFTSFTAYACVHTAHHHHTGADWDEAYKQGLDTRWKRALNLTLPGTLWFLKTPPYEATPEQRARIRIEQGLMAAWAVAVIAALFVWPAAVGYGYLLPLAVTTPLASNLRLILRHAEADPESEYQSGTYYRTGLVSRLLFLADAGDCHTIHHLFPGIPSYRMAHAVRVLTPLLRERGIVERTSLWQLAYLWFVEARAHRSRWDTAPTAARAGVGRPS